MSTDGESPARPGPALSTTKTLLARIPLDIKYIEQLCIRITQLTEGWDKYSTEMEVEQATNLQEQVFTLQAMTLADIGEILTRRQKINDGLMQRGEDDTEVTEFVERSMDAPDGKVKGLVGHMVLKVKDAIKKRCEAIKAPQLEHERQVSGVRTASAGTGQLPAP